MFVGSKVLMLCNFLYFFSRYIFISLCVFSSFIFFSVKLKISFLDRVVVISHPPSPRAAAAAAELEFRWYSPLSEMDTWNVRVHHHFMCCVTCCEWLRKMIEICRRSWSSHLIHSNSKHRSAHPTPPKKQSHERRSSDVWELTIWVDTSHHSGPTEWSEPQVILGEVANGKNTFPGLKAELDDFSPSSHLYSISSRHTTSNNSNQRGEEDFLQHFKSFFRFYLTRISTIRLGFNDMC